MTTYLGRLALVLLVCSCGLRVWAGGSGLNLIVVVNQNSTNSLQLGNYYCEKRQVPPQNVLRLTNWTGGAVQWYRTNFNTLLLNPLLAMVSARGLTNQALLVLLSSDIPYRIRDNDAFISHDSTTAALFYGFKSFSSPWGTCSLPDSSSNSYAFSEMPFAQARPDNAPTNSFLTVMLTHSNLAAAKLIVDRGVASDGTFPTQIVYLAKSTDVDRNVRYTEFDNPIFSFRVLGGNTLLSTNTNSTSFTNTLGLQTGQASFSLPANAFVPGALGDSLTSFGGYLFEDSGGQTRLLAFLTAGASGSYGTVVEPCNYPQKFPDPRDYFYQLRGFTMAEAYYQSVLNPYMGLVVGDPLSAPYALPANGSWSALPTNSLLSGTTNLSLQFMAADTNHPVQQVDLFVDGLLAQTLTNVAPRQNNVLTANVRGHAVSYTVPPSATIASVAAGLTSALNASGVTNLTHVVAFRHGDRIELQSTDLNTPGTQIPLLVSNSVGSAAALTTFLAVGRTNFLDTIAYGRRPYLVTNTPDLGDYLQFSITKTNSSVVTLAVTNTVTNTTISMLVLSLLSLVNASPSLQGSDGLIAEDFIGYDPGFPGAEFNLRARGMGWQAAQIQATLSSSPNLTVMPAGAHRLDDNLNDLRPRNDLYITAGVTNLPLTFAFNTTTQPDGWHELTAVACEGSHVRTQKRVTQTVRIQNTPLNATFTTLLGDSNTFVNATLQFAVVANTNNIASIELFSTGGSQGNVPNQSNATFSVSGSYLGVGLHPFYAVVTATNGKQYRTETKWIRLIASEPPLLVSLNTPPPMLSWTATAGRTYDILSTTNITNTFQATATLTPSNAVAQWTDTNPAALQRFYRVRTAN